MGKNIEFFTTTMPSSRPADYYLGCLHGMVYLDFNNCENGCVRLIRISFDGYGCCQLKDNAIPMDEEDSIFFKEMIKNGISDKLKFSKIVKKSLYTNKELIWEDALSKYKLI